MCHANETNNAMTLMITSILQTNTNRNYIMRLNEPTRILTITYISYVCTLAHPAPWAAVPAHLDSDDALLEVRGIGKMADLCRWCRLAAAGRIQNRKLALLSHCDRSAKVQTQRVSSSTECCKETLASFQKSSNELALQSVL